MACLGLCLFVSEKRQNGWLTQRLGPEMVFGNFLKNLKKFASKKTSKLIIYQLKQKNLRNTIYKKKMEAWRATAKIVKGIHISTKESINPDI